MIEAMKKTYTAPTSALLRFEPANLLLASGGTNNLNVGEASDAGGASETLSDQRIWSNEGSPIWDNE